MRARPERRAVKRQHETRVGRVHEYVARVLRQQRGDLLLVAGVKLHGGPGRGPRARRRGPRALRCARRVLRSGQVIVGYDKLGELAACGDPGERRADSAGPDQKDAHTGDTSPETTRPTGPVEMQSCYN